MKTLCFVIRKIDFKGDIFFYAKDLNLLYLNIHTMEETLLRKYKLQLYFFN